MMSALVALRKRVSVIQSADEQRVGNLLRHLHRIGDAARPESIPDGVDLAAKFAGEYERRVVFRLVGIQTGIKMQKADLLDRLFAFKGFDLVGVRGFEPPTTCTPYR